MTTFETIWKREAEVRDYEPHRPGRMRTREVRVADDGGAVVVVGYDHGRGRGPRRHDAVAFTLEEFNEVIDALAERAERGWRSEGEKP